MRHILAFDAASISDIALTEGDELRLVQEIRKVKSQKTSRKLRELNLASILRRTQSKRVRNAAAIALVDMRAASATEALIDVLKRPETRGARGTLLYALRELRAPIPPNLLIDTIINDSFESGAEALGIVADQMRNWSNADLMRAKSKLRAAMESPKDVRLDVMHRALALLSD